MISHQLSRGAAVARIGLNRMLQSRQEHRHLSTHGVAAVEKLRSVLEQYRRQNYQQELPTRFRKDIMAVAKGSGSDPSVIVLDGMQRVLFNIGAEKSLTEAELHTIFDELGNGTGTIPVQNLAQFL